MKCALEKPIHGILKDYKIGKDFIHEQKEVGSDSQLNFIAYEEKELYVMIKKSCVNPCSNYKN